MKTNVKLQRVADTVDEVVISEWAVEIGSTVAVGDVLVRVETDKALVEVQSPVAGTVLEFLVDIDDEVTTGTPIVAIET
jgi:pyruvate/2-oxoglutarate dehydrogenase complex dihydrolipoamide acyltransferase (E2) component